MVIEGVLGCLPTLKQPNVRVPTSTESLPNEHSLDPGRPLDETELTGFECQQAMIATRSYQRANGLSLSLKP